MGRVEKENLLTELKFLDTATKYVSIEYLRLLVEAEKRRRVVSEIEPFICYVLAFDKLENFLSYYLKSNAAFNRRFQLIINTEEHYSTVDISYKAHKKCCLLLDAANDKRMLIIYKVLRQFEFDHLFVATSRIDKSGCRNHLQKDFVSCSMFAFDHAIQLSRKDIYANLEKLARKDSKNTLHTKAYWSSF